MTFDGMPMVGKYAEDTDNVFVATGFNKWGMANSVAAAGAIADMAEGKPSPLPVFDPARHIRGALGATIVNAINNRDYMLIQGVVLFFALVFVVVNLLVDIAYMLINPRVSYEGGSK